MRIALQVERSASPEADGIQPHEIGVSVHSAAHLPRARAGVETAGLKALELQDSFGTQAGRVSICTMHLAKGLGSRAVVVMACDDEIVPLQDRIW